MGFSVYVHEYVTYRAVCVEPGCGWPGQDAVDRDDAERKVEDHRSAHEEAWKRLGRERERTDEEKDRIACPCLHCPLLSGLTLITSGLDAGRYHCEVCPRVHSDHPPWEFAIVQAAYHRRARTEAHHQ